MDHAPPMKQEESDPTEAANTVQHRSPPPSTLGVIVLGRRRDDRGPHLDERTPDGLAVDCRSAEVIAAAVGDVGCDLMETEPAVVYPAGDLNAGESEAVGGGEEEEREGQRGEYSSSRLMPNAGEQGGTHYTFWRRDREHRCGFKLSVIVIGDLFLCCLFQSG